MNKIADYFQQNPILFIILAALVIVLVIVILIVIIKAIRKSSASHVSKNEADPLPANKENSSSQALKPSDSQTAETISAQTATNQADVSQNNSGIREPQEQTASSSNAPSVSSQSDPKPSSPTQSAQNANDKPKQSADEAEDKKVRSRQEARKRLSVCVLSLFFLLLVAQVDKIFNCLINVKFFARGEFNRYPNLILRPNLFKRSPLIRSDLIKVRKKIF